MGAKLSHICYKKIKSVIIGHIYLIWHNYIFNLPMLYFLMNGCLKITKL